LLRGEDVSVSGSGISELTRELEAVGAQTRTKATPSQEQVLASLERILASEEFAGSAQLSRFLRHVVENGLTGEAARLKESVVGVTVFNRGPGYDPKVDPIVRVEARRLRTRLEAYYRNSDEGGGANDPVRISLPKGAYVPQFELSQAPEHTIATPVEPSPTEAPVQRVPPKSPTRFGRLVVALAVFVAAMLTVVFAYRARTPDRLVTSFWSSILDADRPALIIPADSALVMLQDLSHQPVQLQDYITGEYRPRLTAKSQWNPDIVSNLAGRRYTSIADLEFASRISHRPEAAHRGVLTRFARDVRVEDLKGNNLMLLGARHSNPWVELFEKDATFRLEHDEQTGVFQVENTRPEHGEQETIVVSPAELRHEIYGIITYHRNREGSGNVLVVAGTSVAGTEAAADFLLDEARILPWLRQAAAGGDLHGFDILLHDRNLSGSAPRAEVVAFHGQK
jgi:hypothetical protein